MSTEQLLVLVVSDVLDGIYESLINIYVFRYFIQYYLLIYINLFNF